MRRTPVAVREVGPALCLAGVPALWEEAAAGRAAHCLQMPISRWKAGTDPRAGLPSRQAPSPGRSAVRQFAPPISSQSPSPGQAHPPAKAVLHRPLPASRQSHPSRRRRSSVPCSALSDPRPLPKPSVLPKTPKGQTLPRSPCLSPVHPAQGAPGNPRPISLPKPIVPPTAVSPAPSAPSPVLHISCRSVPGRWLPHLPSPVLPISCQSPSPICRSPPGRCRPRFPCQGAPHTKVLLLPKSHSCQSPPPAAKGRLPAIRRPMVRPRAKPSPAENVQYLPAPFL
jgi:hypothetical protein